MYVCVYGFKRSTIFVVHVAVLTFRSTPNFTIETAERSRPCQVSLVPTFVVQASSSQYSLKSLQPLRVYKRIVVVMSVSHSLLQMSQHATI